MKHEHRHKIFKPVYANDNEEETKPSLEKKKKKRTYRMFKHSRYQ